MGILKFGGGNLGISFDAQRLVLVRVRMWPKLQGEQFEGIASVILRVPGIFILDYWWQYEKWKLWPQTFEWTDLVGIVLSALGKNFLECCTLHNVV